MFERPPGVIREPLGSRHELATKPPFQLESSDSSYVGHGPSFVDFDADGINEIRRTYYAMVSLVDDCGGRVLNELDRRGKADNTLVLFTSDHGEMLGDHAMLLKGPMMYDTAVRVPLIVRWPAQVPAGARVGGLVGVHDVARTVRPATGLRRRPRTRGWTSSPSRAVKDRLATGRSPSTATPATRTRPRSTRRCCGPQPTSSSYGTAVQRPTGNALASCTTWPSTRTSSSTEPPRLS